MYWRDIMASPEQNSPLTFSRFVEFFEKSIQPQLNEIILIRSDLKNYQQKADDRFDFLFKKYGDFSQELTIITHQLKRIDQRLDSIEGRMTHLETRMNKIENTVQQIDARLTKQEKEFLALKDQLSRLELQQGEIKKLLEKKKATRGKEGPKNKKLETEFTRLKSEVATLQNRIDILERSTRH